MFAFIYIHSVVVRFWKSNNSICEKNHCAEQRNWINRCAKNLLEKKIVHRHCFASKLVWSNQPINSDNGTYFFFHKHYQPWFTSRYHSYQHWIEHLSRHYIPKIPQIPKKMFQSRRKQEKEEDQCELSVPTKLRILNDIGKAKKEILPGIHVHPDEMDITKFHALIEGPENTPYSAGFFYFLLRFPRDYPMSPPKAKLLTTGNGNVRFNPNLYDCGKVCLSILGTWEGPGWSPCHDICSVLISIQS